MDLDFVASLLYLGNVIGFLGLTLGGGLTGRKNLMIISMGFLFVGLFITIFCVNLIMAGIGLFLACVGVQCGFNICFYFISETIS
jgi:MFS family permease